MTTLPEGMREWFAAQGKLGGKARAKALTEAERKAIGKKGAVARAETLRHAATLNWFFTPKMAREIQAAAAAAAEKSHPKTSRK